MIEFWYEFGSTYSYPAAMRIERLAERRACRWPGVRSCWGR
jgi:2-hydroxychromene-2-carboxylate isomerase